MALPAIGHIFAIYFGVFYIWIQINLKIISKNLYMNSHGELMAPTNSLYFT